MSQSSNKRYHTNFLSVVSTVTQPQDKCQEICFVHSCHYHHRRPRTPKFVGITIECTWVRKLLSTVTKRHRLTDTATDTPMLCWVLVGSHWRLYCSSTTWNKIVKLPVFWNKEVLSWYSSRCENSDKTHSGIINIALEVVELKDILSNVASAICGCVEISPVLFLGKI